jgi:Domain of unknown function (DUF4347)/Domain of unknown function (DUF4114)
MKNTINSTNLISSVPLSQTIVFIDSSVDDYEFLVNGVTLGVEVRVIASHKNGIEQITTQLQNFVDEGRSVDEIHILSHGNPGCIYLGSTVLNADTLEEYHHELQQWQKLLNKQANIFLYGCKIAADSGQYFVENLAKLTHANITAATKFIGNIAGVINWNLDFSTGKIQGNAPFSAAVMANYPGILATITVTSNADSGAGSLRQVIANAVAGDTITFASSLAYQTITLTSGQLTINKNLTIDGGAATNLKISGNNASRVFEVTPNPIYLPSTVVFRNLIIANGRVNGTDESAAGGGIKTGDSTTLLIENCQLNNNYAGFAGGGIFTGFKGNNTIINSKFDGNIGAGVNTERGGGAIATKNGGSLTVKYSEFINNKGTTGGAINSLLETLTVENSIFKNNDTLAGASIASPAGEARGYGGAIYTDGANASGPNFDYGLTGGTINIRNSQFDGNTGAGQGGALFLYAYYSDKINIENTTITNNKVIKDIRGHAFGAGVRIGIELGRYADQPIPEGGFTIKNSTIANNTSLSQGGGLWVGEDSKGSIINSTFSGNKADDGSGNGLGGAISFINRGNPVSVTNTTIAYNHAGFQGGAFQGGGTNITLRNTIVGYSTAGNIWGVKINTLNQFSDGGSNIQWPPKSLTDSSDMNITSSPSLIIADPKLDSTLKDNGGGILTHALLTGSPAINTGTTTTVTTDERGFNRDSNPDIGAFEFGASGGSYPGVNITQSGGSTYVTEGGVTDSYAVVLNIQPTGNVNIAINKGTQLTTNLTQLVFTSQNWNLAQTVTVTAVNDNVAEGYQNTTIQHTATSTDSKYNAIAISSVNVGITDNDPGVMINESGTYVTEGGATDNYSVVLSTQPTGNVAIAINRGTQLTTNFTQLVFTAQNWNLAQTVTVTAVNDNVAEGYQNATIQHTATSTDSKYNAIAVSAVNVGITDNDIAGVNITQSGGSTYVTEGGVTDSYAVVLKSQPTGNVTIAINRGTQLTTNLTQLVFTSQNWNLAQTVTVTAVNDTLVEGYKNATIQHTATSTDSKYNAIAISSVNLGITDNDPGVMINESGTYVIEGGATDNYSVVLSTQPTANVTVAINRGTQLTTNLTQLVFTSLNWNVAQTVTVTAVNDNVAEGYQTATIQHTATSADSKYNAIATSSVNVGITDNDTSLAISQSTRSIAPMSTSLSVLEPVKMIDLRGFTSPVKAEFVVNREAAKNNFVGFYKVTDVNGGIDTNSDGKADILPGQVGYTEAAVRGRVLDVNLKVNNGVSSIFRSTLTGADIYAPFIIVDGRPGAIIDNNPNNDPAIYFSFLGANSDNSGHVRMLENNFFGFEDQPHGGDFDFNDMTVQVKLTSV